MNRHFARLAIGAAIMMGGTTLISTEASAQATRTWISGVGADDNPCSRTAPCRTWQGAITKTAEGGEIDCLDGGGFGAVTVTKSMTLYCPYNDGGVLVAGQNGIIVNDSAGTPGTAHVVIDGLNLEGLGFSSTSPGIGGIYFASGASLTVRNTSIRDFRDPTNGAGIRFVPSTSAKLVVVDSLIVGNGNTGVGGGIFIQPSGTATVDAVIKNTTLSDNTNAGINVNLNSTSGTSKVQVINSVVSNNTNGINAATTTAAKVQMLVQGSTITNNAGYGVAADGGGAKVWVSGNNISNNGTDGLKIVGFAVISTFGDNVVYGNPANASTVSVTKM